MISRLSHRYLLFFTGIYLVLLLGISSRVWGAQNVWEVQYGNTDLTDSAAAIPTSGTPLLNVTNIGPILGILVSPQPSSVQLRAPDRTLWTWETGSSFLTSDGQIMPLRIPGMQQGFALYLDAETIAELAQLELVIDSDAKKLIYTSKEFTPPPQPEIGDGWKSFTIEKPKSEIKKSTMTKNVQQEVISPSARDKLDIGVGIGYVQHADFGLELTANGKANGGDMNAWAFVTNGNEGMKLKNSYFKWVDRERGIGLEGGDLYSQSWGLARGLRYSWNTGKKHWPSVGGYLRTDKALNPNPYLSYRDELKIGDNLIINGEFGTDQSRYVTANYKNGNLELYGYQRHLPDDLGDNEGLLASYSILRSATVYYGRNSSTSYPGGSSTSETIGLRIPIMKRYNLTLDQTEYDSGTTSSTVRSAGLTVPLANSINMYIRYQENSSDIDIFAGELITMRNNSNSLLTSLSLFASPQLRLNYQMTRYTHGGQTSDYQQLIANYKISDRTSLQAISGFPNILDTDLLRLRLEQKMNNNTSLTVDYGRLSPYQRADNIFGRRGFMIMLRKKMPFFVPATGGKVSGHVYDQLGQPVDNIVVQLGQYRALSDKSGEYSFDFIPTGMYQISIPSECVPADYKVEAISQQVNVKRNSDYTFDFTLVPLSSITGYIFIDKNGNGECDLGEGIANVAVCANDRSTASDKTGRFGFYNLEPGKYTVRIAAEVLDKRYVVKGIEEMGAEVQPDKSVTGLHFQLEEFKKPILFTKLD